MAKLIDDIRAGVKVHAPKAIEDMARWSREAERVETEIVKQLDLPVFYIDNVTEYMYAQSREWDFVADFPNVAPPFEEAWFEFRSRDPAIPRGRIGIFMAALSVDNGFECPNQDALLEWLQNARWLEAFYIFLDFGRHRGIMGPIGVVRIPVDEKGQVTRTPSIYSYGAYDPEEKDLQNFYAPVLLAISFLHCKNVRVVSEKPPEPVAKKYERQHGIKPTPVKILELHPLKEILRREGRSDVIGLKRALHICRGHFRDYREGHGLFGKHHQLVWMPQIVRGKSGGDEKPRGPQYDVKLDPEIQQLTRLDVEKIMRKGKE